MRCVTQICLTVSGLCVDGRVLLVVSLLFVGIVWFIIRSKYIPVAAGIKDLFLAWNDG